MHILQTLIFYSARTLVHHVNIVFIHLIMDTSALSHSIRHRAATKTTTSPTISEAMWKILWVENENEKSAEDRKKIGEKKR